MIDKLIKKFKCILNDGCKMERYQYKLVVSNYSGKKIQAHRRRCELCGYKENFWI
jgi:hypothetical protein